MKKKTRERRKGRENIRVKIRVFPLTWPRGKEKEITKGKYGTEGKRWERCGKGREGRRGDKGNWKGENTRGGGVRDKRMGGGKCGMRKT